MKSIICHYLLILLLLGCTSPTPKDILPEDKLVSIITDLQMADAAYKLKMLPEKYSNQPEKYFLEILANHQVDSATYHKSMRFYAEDPTKLRKLYQKVELNIQQASNKR